MTFSPAPLDVACQLGVIAAGADVSVLGDALVHLEQWEYRRVVMPRIDPAVTDVAAVARVFAASSLTPIAMAGITRGADVGSSDQSERDAGKRMLRQALEVAVLLGADQLNGVPYGPFGGTGPVDQAHRDRAALAVGEIANEAHERGVAMTFEVLNRYETSVVNTAEQAVQFVEASASEHLGIHLDTYHMGVEEAGLEEALRLALPWLGYLELGQSGRGALSQGMIDIPAVVAVALDAGYVGRFGVEAFSRRLLPAAVADRLAIWRSPYEDGIEVARDAQWTIRRGWDQSTVGRRDRREQRASAARNEHTY